MSKQANNTPFENTETDTPWFDRKFQRRKRISISKKSFKSSIKKFPLLISLKNDPDLAQHAQPDGSDIVFTAGDGTTALPHQQIVHQRILRDQAVWTIWTGPRAIRNAGNHDRTYVAYYTTNQGWWISSYDHNESEWQHHQLRSHEQSAGGRWWDDHNNPALTIRNDGRILAVYGEHSTERSWARISTNPEDITSWQSEIPFTQEQKIAKRTNHWLKFFAKRVLAKLTNTKRPKLYDPAYSYVNLYTLPDGTIWRQYRPLTGWSGISRNPTFIISEDGGTTWGDPVRFIKEKNRSPYLVTAQEGYKIHFFFSDAHPDEWNKTSIYHAYYDHSEGTYHKTNGSLIGGASCLPFSPAQATKIYDGTTSAGEAWVYDVTVDENGKIAGLFNVYSGKKEGKSSFRIHEYWYAFWNGSSWKTSKIDSESDIFSAGQKRYSGGFVVDTVDISCVYLSLVDSDGTENGFTRHIWRYQTKDHGATWARTRITRKGQGKAHSRPVVPINRHPDLPVFWQYGHYVNYLEYRTALAAADHGTLVDSEHYVQVSEIHPEEDLNIYVYYNNESKLAHSSHSNRKVWPSSCLLSYRGTLTQNGLGKLSPQIKGTALTFELSAVWASDRKGRGEAAILASDTESESRIWIGKSDDDKLEVRLSSSFGQESIIFDDLLLKGRPWKDSGAPVERSIIQLSILEDGSVHARLNATKSRIKRSFEGFIKLSPADLGHLFIAPDTEGEGIPFQGWLETVRIYKDILDENWLNISAMAECKRSAFFKTGKKEKLGDIKK